MSVIDPHEMAKAELASAMIPAPEDQVTDLTPIGALYLLEQMGWAVLTLWTAHAEDQVSEADDVTSDLATTLQGIGTCVGMLDEICARIGVLPLEAVPPK